MKTTTKYIKSSRSLTYGWHTIMSFDDGYQRTYWTLVKPTKRKLREMKKWARIHWLYY